MEQIQITIGVSPDLDGKAHGGSLLSTPMGSAGVVVRGLRARRFDIVVDGVLAAVLELLDLCLVGVPARFRRKYGEEGDGGLWVSFDWILMFSKVAWLDFVLLYGLFGADDWVVVSEVAFLVGVVREECENGGSLASCARGTVANFTCVYGVFMTTLDYSSASFDLLNPTLLL
ncbi:hypothetical protein H5410_003730 [Solanum commersonii]|uniref:Uncharacterized protein n=1 Tax=Solanum commersonii TaxID=4109 RepID=A0A9J6B5G2_SOLCO|nr:hypothetical protein H5410_003730 [Solanum commersonii]